MYPIILVKLFIYIAVALGGVANLFLGFSILSVVEFIYWTLKICVNTFIRLCK